MKSKPPSMSVREWLIKTLSARENLPQVSIAKIITHNYETAHAAFKVHNSIEIAGFGKFYYNVKKAEKQMEKCLSQQIAYQKILDDPLITEKKKHSYNQRMLTILGNIAALNNKDIL